MLKSIQEPSLGKLVLEEHVINQQLVLVAEPTNSLVPVVIQLKELLDLQHLQVVQIVLTKEHYVEDLRVKLHVIRVGKHILVHGMIIFIEKKVVRYSTALHHVLQMQDVDGNHLDNKYKIVLWYVKTITGMLLLIISVVIHLQRLKMVQ